MERFPATPMTSARLPSRNPIAGLRRCWFAARRGVYRRETDVVIVRRHRLAESGAIDHSFPSLPPTTPVPWSALHQMLCSQRSRNRADYRGGSSCRSCCSQAQGRVPLRRLGTIPMRASRGSRTRSTARSPSARSIWTRRVLTAPMSTASSAKSTSRRCNIIFSSVPTGWCR